MSERCAVKSCKEVSRVLCYCCDQNLCLDHLPTHRILIDYQSLSLPVQVNLLNEQMKRLDKEKLIADARRQLTNWRDETFKRIERFYEQKCEELQRYYHGNIRQKQNQIDQLHQQLTDFNENPQTRYEDSLIDLQMIIMDAKNRVDAIEQKGIPMITHSLILGNGLIIIGEGKTAEFDVTMLAAPPYQTFDCSVKFGSSLAANDRILLIDENPTLTLYDSDLTIIHQSSWKGGTIYDMCWSSILSSFIIITEKSKAFLMNGENFSVSSIEEMQNQLWISCTCSNSLLYLASLSNGVVEFSLLPSISYVKRWDPPMTCKNNESIKDIACNDVALALLVSPSSNKQAQIILRSLVTFDELFSIDLQIRYSLYQFPTRCCPLKNNEWLVIDANTSHIFHISKDGKMKGTFISERPPYNAVLFNSDKLLIRTEDTINVHQLFN